MPKRPRVVGLMLCRRMGVDPVAAEASLVGLFHTFHVSSWTDPVPPFSVFALLTGGKGEGTIKLVIRRLETEDDVYRWQRWTVFSDPDLIAQNEIVVRRCVFPAPGRYLLILSFDGAELANRVVTVLPREGVP